MEHEVIKYDVIIVGGGPAGCSSAYELNKSGLRVLILDKTNFPRHKPCAGGITMKTLKHLPIDISHLVQHRAKKMIFNFGGNKQVNLNHNNGSCIMVIRDEFDKYFFEKTIESGVKFNKIFKINYINSLQNKIIISADDTEYECKYLIGADGANSVVRKLSSSINYSNPVFAYEGLIEKNNTNYQTEFIFNKSGYAWIFPKKDHYNVGIGTLIPLSGQKRVSKKELTKFVSERFHGQAISNITAFPIGTEGDNYQTSNNIFLVGDAAGLAESLLGEGIYNAVISGKYCALSIVSACSNKRISAKESYNKFLSQLTRELRLYRKGSKILYRFPKISYWMMRFGLGKKFMDGYSEGKTLSEIMGKSNQFTI